MTCPPNSTVNYTTTPQMSESPSSSTQNGLTTIPIEIISEEEMAFLEAALSSTTRSLSSPSRVLLFQPNARNITSISNLSKKRLEDCRFETEIEDLNRPLKKKNRVFKSLMEKHRRKGFVVTDLTRAEWCEMQLHFELEYGKRKPTEAMKAGKARHAKLEKEVVKKDKVNVKSSEDIWALRFSNFIAGVNQLIFKGLTREIPLIGLIDGVWLSGYADEIRKPGGEDNEGPILIETKTRKEDTLPAEPQKRNGRFQLMCYKLLWDTLVYGKFAIPKFYEFFSLDPNHILSEEIREHIAGAGLPAKTLDDVLKGYINTCSMLSPSNDKLILRYESQNDNSLLGEDEFTYNNVWLKSQIQTCIEIWQGEREARCTPEEERWKCRSCQYASICPAHVTISPKKTVN